MKWLNDNIIRFVDLERLPASRFRYDNMIRFMRLATPVYIDTPTGMNIVEKPWILLGWSDNVNNTLMCGQEGQIALMMFHPEEGEAWEHYPLFDGERENARFVYR